MKQFLFKIKDLIERGILRIFPLPTIYFALLAATTLLIGCVAPRQTTQLVRDIQRDTIYLSNVQYDSIYIMKDRLTDRSKDTIYIKDVSVEYRYKLLRDTVCIVERDSIPYEVTVIETKEITRPLTWYDHLCRISLWFMIGVLTFAIYKTFRR